LEHYYFFKNRIFLPTSKCSSLPSLTLPSIKRMEGRGSPKQKSSYFLADRSPLPQRFLLGERVRERGLKRLHHPNAA